jgi:hypothetical protein
VPLHEVIGVDRASARLKPVRLKAEDPRGALVAARSQGIEAVQIHWLSPDGNLIRIYNVRAEDDAISEVVD